MNALWHVARSFTATRWRTRKGLSRATFEAWQAGEIRKWLRQDVPKVQYYSAQPQSLASLPVIDKATMMAQFDAFNQQGITAQQGWEQFGRTGSIGDVSVGASTGTSGNRALYLVTPRERLRWLGVILAKALPNFPVQSERVAVILPQSSALYDTAARTRRLELSFFDLRDGMETWLSRLCDFDPTCMIGPPRVLRALAQLGTGLNPRIVYSSAETLDPVDRNVIEAAFGLTLGQIYMATEGLFGVSCRNGRVHLAEDAVHFEFEPSQDGLVNPIVSCFQRQFQIMARYRMNDLLRLCDEPCPCGSPLRAVKEIVGRMDDMFIFRNAERSICFTPDILRNVVLDADRGIDDFRIRRVSRNRVELILPQGSGPARLRTAQSALENLMQSRWPDVTVRAKTDVLGLDPSRKLRRVENRWNGEGS